MFFDPYYGIAVLEISVDMPLRCPSFVLNRQETQPATASVEHRQKQLPQARRIPAELRDRCFNCLSYSHRGATCRLPRCCLRCHGYRHLAKDHRRPRSAKSVTKSDNLPRHSACGDPPASQPLGGPSSNGATLEAMGVVDGTCRR